MIGDLLLTCADCGQEYTLSNKDQEFFQMRGYSMPKRCTACRQAKKNEQGTAREYQTSETQGTSIICSDCGKQATVPFEPRGDRPVYCQDCHQSRKRSAAGRGHRKNYR